MAYESFLDASGTTKYRKTTGASSTGDPSVLHNIIDSGTVTTVSTVTGVTTVSTVSSVTALGTVTPGTAATNLGKAEDAVHASGDVGVMGLAVRNDAGTALAADGDYVPLTVNSSGALYVTGGGGGTQYAVDAALGATPTGSLAIAIRDDALSALTPVEGDAIGLRVDANGALWVIPSGTTTVSGTVAATQSGTWNITNISGTISLPTGAATAAKQPALGTAGTASADVITVQGIASMTAIKTDGSGVTQPVSGTVTATISAGASTIAKAEDVASADGDVGVPFLAVRKATPANTSGTDGDYEFAQISAGRLWTSATIDTALPAGTNAIGKLASNTGVTIGAVEIASSQTLATVTTVGTVTTCSTLTTLTGGGVAHDGADSGNPIKIGAKATASLSGATMVASADRSDIFCGVDGVLITRPHANLEDITSGTATNTDGASTQCIAAAGAGVKLYLTSVTISNTSATAVEVVLKSATTAKWTFPVPANTSGVVFNFNVPLPPNAANEAWNFDPSAAANTISCSMVAFKSKI